MVKLIVSDFDGTLMPYGQSAVSSVIKSQIEYALDSRIAFAVSSGRTYLELVSYLPEFKDRIYFICCDGAYYIKDGKLLYAKMIEASDLLAFFNAAVCGRSFVMHGAESNYSFGSLPSEAAIFEPTEVKSVFDIKEKIFKVTTYGGEFALRGASALRMHWDGGKNLSAQYVNKFANKGSALSDLQVRLMVTGLDTACIGDSHNDAAMMKGTKYSYSVGSRCPELAQATRFNTPTAEDALGEILKTV